MPYDERGGYFVGLAGESHYQPAIRRSSEGEEAIAYLEPTNRYDPEAIVITNARKEIIGYIPRDNFLKDVVHEQALGFSARIESIQGTSGKLGVVLHVQLNDDEMPVWRGPKYTPVAVPQALTNSKAGQKTMAYVIGAGLLGLLYLIGKCTV